MDQPHNLSNIFCFDGKMNSILKLFGIFFLPYGKEAVDGTGGTIKCSVWRNARTTTAAPNDVAVAYYELAKTLNMGIT